MRLKPSNHTCAALALAVCATAWAQSPHGQPGAPAGKIAEQQFKNIQVLQGTPADQVFPAMQYISASLGVECEFCHVEGKFDADDKPNKKTARKMITMTLAINKDSFNARKEVTCYTCHRGNNDPVGTPPVVTTDAEPEHAKEAAAPAAGATRSADQMIERYMAAVGGAEALHKITSRVSKGNISFGGHETPIELFAKAPDKRMSITHSANGDSITAFDGHGGWLGNTGRPAREMSGQEAEAARLDADFYLATHLKEIFSGFRVGRPDKIGDHPAYTLICLREGQPPVRLYFDESSGLLLRQVRYTDTPIGRSPTQIDYADYREIDGVKVPFRWTLSRVNGRFTIQMNEAQQNVPIEDAKFTKP
ncbi:MAG TPA: c-type cytochrome [Bryobacteraceae bacterium]|nr:c-type cytochrome [Bryobacteraceae bacterium]